MTRVLISCGEASGDLYAAALTTSLRALDPTVNVFGFGGPRLAATGADLVGHFRGFSVTGILDAASVLKKSWAMLRTLKETARARRPDVFVAIDFPDFNFRLLPAMQAQGIPIVYYVSPQLWAWRPKRIETLRRYVNRMLVIFPFETAIYEKAGVPVEFVGHPLVDLVATKHDDRASWLRARGLDAARPVVAFLPGSRGNEVTRILPVLADAAPIIASRVPGAQFLVARAPSLDVALFAPLDRVRAAGIPVASAADAADDVLATADVAATASGTATVQAALHDRPMVIVYRLAPLDYAIGRAFVRVSTYGMVNLVAGRSVVPELIQDRCTAENVAAEVVSLLTDKARAETMRRDLADVRRALGEGGASARAAAAVLRAAKKP
jgi:lipid-A-disaccharide synthase